MFGIKYQEFFEPDIGNQRTAIAVEALSRKQHSKLFNKLKLTLSWENLKQSEQKLKDYQ